MLLYRNGKRNMTYWSWCHDGEKLGYHGVSHHHKDLFGRGYENELEREHLLAVMEGRSTLGHGCKHFLSPLSV